MAVKKEISFEKNAQCLFYGEVILFIIIKHNFVQPFL